MGKEEAALCRESGACAAGFVSVQRVMSHMTAAQREQAWGQLPGLTGLFCFAFPYFAGAERGNLSLYARSVDYHRAVEERLQRAAALLRADHPQARFRPYADKSPFPEVWAAACAGLGKLGQNGLLLTEGYGSFVFLGVLATDLPREGGGDPVPCRGCGQCRRACPGGALDDRGGVAQERCLSALTQKRGALTAEQAALVAQHTLIWGCDSCQLACPENRDPLPTALPEFCPPLRSSLRQEELACSERSFRRQYADCAFSWRGAQPLRRNLQLQEERKK